MKNRFFYSKISHLKSFLYNKCFKYALFHQLHCFLGTVNANCGDPVLCFRLLHRPGCTYRRILIHACDHLQIRILFHQFLCQIVRSVKKRIAVHHFHNILLIISQAFAESLLTFHSCGNPFHMTDHCYLIILAYDRPCIFPKPAPCFHIVCGYSQILQFLCGTGINIGNANAFFFCFFQIFIGCAVTGCRKKDPIRILFDCFFKKTDLAFNILFIFRCHHFQLNSIFTGSHPGSGNKRRPEITGSVFGFGNIDQRQWCAALLLLQDIACKKAKKYQEADHTHSDPFFIFFHDLPPVSWESHS